MNRDGIVKRRHSVKLVLMKMGNGNPENSTYIKISR